MPRRVWLSAALAFLSGPSVAADAPKYAYGVVTAIQFLQNDKAVVGLNKLDELGVGYVRIGLDWSIVQPQPVAVQADTFDFAFTDQMIKNAHAHGIKIFATLGGPPAWAAPCANCMPKDPKAWYWYVRRVVEHYQWLGNDIAFGVWNEPNDTYFLSADGKEFKSNTHHRADSALYSALAIGALKARDESSNPSAKLGVPEGTPAIFDDPHWWEFWKGESWHDAVWKAVQPHMKPQDIVTIHYYPEKGWTDADMYAFMADVDAHFGRRETWMTEGFSDDLSHYVNAFTKRPAAHSNWKRLFVYRLWGGDDDPQSLLKANWTNRPVFDDYRKAIPGAAKNGAVIVFLQGPPATMSSGQNATVSVTVKNSGAADWTEPLGYKLGAQNPPDNTFWRLGRVPLNKGETVKAGAQHTFTWTITAPNKPGTYPFQWRMVQEKVQWFGQSSPSRQVVVK